jgi:predicted DNA-binding transcriptional regulator AlpA
MALDDAKDGAGRTTETADPLSALRPGDRLVRIDDILAPRGPIPVSASRWWAGVRSGDFPQPLKLGHRTTVWLWSDICGLARTGVTRFSRRSAKPAPRAE